MFKAVLAAATAVTLIACAPQPQEGGGSATQLPATPPQAEPAGLADLQGARAGQAEGAIFRRGYELSRQEGLTSFYANAQAGDCWRVVTGDGLYQVVEQVGLDACGQGGGAATAAAPTAAEQACLRDVTATTNNPDVSLIESSFSEAGTEVIVGVGPQRARWSCIAYEDGTTAGITSLTNEGTL